MTRHGRSLRSLHAHPVEPAPLDPLLIGLFFLVYLMVFAGALAAEAMSYDASLQWLLRKRLERSP